MSDPGPPGPMTPSGPHPHPRWWTRLRDKIKARKRESGRHRPELRADLLAYFRFHPGRLVRVTDFAADPDKVREAITILRDRGEPIGEAIPGQLYMYLPLVEQQDALQNAGHIDAGPYWHG